MSLWQFTESSQPLLRRCIEASNTNRNTNKWIQKFGNKSMYNNEINAVLITNCDSNSALNNEDITMTKTLIEHMDIDEKNDCRTLQEHEDFCREISDLDPVTHFDYIVSRCLENSNLLRILAKQLPISSIEKLCKHIFESQNTNPTFVEKFYTSFLTAFLKREPTRLSLDLLVKAKCYPIFFKHLLLIITKDTELPINILHDFVSTLNASEQTEFLISLSQFDIPNEIFIHKLSTIHTAYKDCQKSSKIQNYILLKLTQVSQNCSTDKYYGKFLISFLKSYKDYPTDILEIENLVVTHKSCFRKPCLNILNEIKKES